MTIDKAIKALHAIKETGEYEGDPDDSQAIQLGIEALKQVYTDKESGFYEEDFLLPGETEEE